MCCVVVWRLPCVCVLFGTATNDLTGGARRGKGAMVISDTLALSSKRDRQGGGAARSPTAAAELPSPRSLVPTGGSAGSRRERTTHPLVAAAGPRAQRLAASSRRARRRSAAPWRPRRPPRCRGRPAAGSAAPLPGASVSPSSPASAASSNSGSVSLSSSVSAETSALPASAAMLLSCYILPVRAGESAG